MSPEESPRLLLRPWRPDDAPALRAAIDESLDQLKPWISWARDEPSPLPALADRLARYAEDFAGGARWRFAVVDADSGELLGGASLHPYPGPDALEVGYWVRSSRQREGTARRAAAALTRRAFASHGVQRAEIWCDPGNAPSAAVARSLGFGYVGPLVTTRDDGSERTVEVYWLEGLEDLTAPPDERLVIAEGPAMASGDAAPSS